jgi:hypothetical protein
MARIMHNYPRSQHTGPLLIGSEFTEEPMFRAPINQPIQGQPVLQPVNLPIQEQSMPFQEPIMIGGPGATPSTGIPIGLPIMPQQQQQPMPTIVGSGAIPSTGIPMGLPVMPQQQQGMPTRIEELSDFQDNIQYGTGLDRLRALQQLGLMSLPMPGEEEEEFIEMDEGGSIADAAGQLEGFGRGGDDILVHMNPEELQGLSSLGNITYNPITGLPEAWSLRNIFRPVKRIAKAIVKPFQKFAKSKLGRMVLPAAGAFLAPWTLGLSWAASPLMYSLAAGAGSGLGSLLGGAKPGDALRAAAMGGLATYAGGHLFNQFGGGAGEAVKGGTQQLSQGIPKYAPGAAPIRIPVGQPIPTAPIPQGGNPFFRAMTPSAPVISPPISQAARLGGMGGSTGTFTGLTAPQTQVIRGGVSPSFLAKAPVPEGSAIQFTGGGTQAIDPNLVRAGGLGPTGRESILRGDFTRQGLQNLPGDLSQMGKDLYTKATTTPEGWGMIGREFVPGADELSGYGQTNMDDQIQAAGIQRKVMGPGLRAVYIHPDTGVDMTTEEAWEYIRSKTGLTDEQRLERAETTGYGIVSPNVQFRPNASGGLIGSGGLTEMAYGGSIPEFSGRVTGDGHGMEDNVRMPIMGRAHGKQVGTLAVSPSEYVVDSYTMAALGNGNADKGADVMDQTVKQIRKKAYGTVKQPNEIGGLSALQTLTERV